MYASKPLLPVNWSTAATIRAKSAILGLHPRERPGAIPATPATKSSTAPNRRGRTASNAGQTSESSLRHSSGMRLTRIGSKRSARSPRITPTSMPLIKMQRRNAKTWWSPSEYNRLRTSPSPVTARQMESLNQCGISLRLSKPTSQLPAAAVTQEFASRGGFRDGTGDGSISCTSIRCVVVLAEPCSPKSAGTGCAMSGQKHDTIQANSSGLSASSTLISGHRSSMLPPRSGTGSSPISAVRRNSTADCSTTHHPLASMRTARPSCAPRSSHVAPPCSATRMCKLLG